MLFFICYKKVHCFVSRGEEAEEVVAAVEAVEEARTAKALNRVEVQQTTITEAVVPSVVGVDTCLVVMVVAEEEAEAVAALAVNKSL